MTTLAPMPAAVSTGRVPLTVVIPTLNEAARIGEVVRDLAWVDEVIVVDGGSTDHTRAVAKAGGARVLLLEDATIGAQRNAGIEAAANDWVLALDADERVSRSLRDELARVVAVSPADSPCTTYRVRFRNRYLGREMRHGAWGRDSHVRLFSRERRFSTRAVHEHVEDVEDAPTLNGFILHESYRDLAHHATKIIRYSQWGAADLRARGRRGRLRDLVLRPAWRFGRDYVLFSGWRDGVPGFVAAVLSAFAVFLKYAFLLTGVHEATPRHG